MRIPERWLTQECIDAALGAPPKGTSIPVIASPFVDRWLARAHPFFPAALYLPAATMSIGLSAHFGAHAGGIVSGFFGGWVLFTAVEYGLHRFVFHRKFGDDRAARIEWFLTHGYHHIYPNDRMRLVMPAMASVPLAVVFAATYIAIAGMSLGLALFAGTLVGYVIYDTSHYLLHHGRSKSAAMRWLKKYHQLHHATGGHSEEEVGRYGVSSPLWDLVFGTYREPGRRVVSTTNPR